MSVIPASRRKPSIQKRIELMIEGRDRAYLLILPVSFWFRSWLSTR